MSNASVYFNRKGLFALNVQAMSEYRTRFQFIYIDSTGSSHDHTAYKLRDSFNILQTEDGSGGTVWILGGRV